MSELSCQQCYQIAAELALDVLPGRERGNALRHLNNCPRCRSSVRALAGTADQLIELVPEASPPDGFERRVVAALTTSSRPPRRWPARAAALLGGLALITSGWLAFSRPTQPTQAPSTGIQLVRYAPVVGQDQELGRAFFYPGDPPWIYLSLAARSGPAGTTVSCEAVRQDGATSSLGTLPLDHGDARWTVPTPAKPDPVVAARLVDQTGHTVAMARFAQPPDRSSGRPMPERQDADHDRWDDQHNARSDDHSDHSNDHRSGGSDNRREPSGHHDQDPGAHHSKRGSDH